MTDWAVGDLALCVGNSHADNDAALPSNWKPMRGGIYNVSAVVWVPAPPAGVGLRFIEDTDDKPFSAWDARDFRKVTPGAEIVGVEEPTRISIPHLFPEPAA